VGFRAFGVLALFGGVGYAMISGALAHHLDHPTAVLVSGPSPFSNCHNRRSDDTSYLNSEVEPFVASNPTSLGTGRVNLVAVWQQDRLLHGLAAGIGSAFSEDGGRTWAETQLPFTSCVTGGASFNRVTDPWVSIGPDGTVYAAAVAEQNNYGVSRSVTGVLVSTSLDGGRSWSSAQMLGGTNGADKASITADPTRPGVAYAVWRETDIHSGDDEWISRTSDAGRTWSPQAILIAGNGERFTVGDQIVVDRHREILYDFFDLASRTSDAHQACGNKAARHLCYRMVGEAQSSDVYASSIAFIRSTDGGKTWTQPRSMTRDLSAGPPDAYVPPRTGRYVPAAAISPSTGDLVVVWQDARFNHGAFDGIVEAGSRDGGKRWSRPRLVSGTVHRAFTPAVQIDFRGNIGISYYTLQAPYTSSRPLWTQYWFRCIGRTSRLARPVQLGTRFDIKTAPPLSGYFVGDYEGITALHHSFEAVFVKANTGNLDNRTDVYAIRIPSSRC